MNQGLFPRKVRRRKSARWPELATPHVSRAIPLPEYSVEIRLAGTHTARSSELSHFRITSSAASRRGKERVRLPVLSTAAFRSSGPEAGSRSSVPRAYSSRAGKPSPSRSSVAVPLNDIESELPGVPFGALLKRQAAGLLESS